MIVGKDTDVEQFGALTGRTVTMDFAADAKGHLMDILAKGLYGKPKTAVLREYSTNALDAQIEAGYSGPIEITLPTDMNPLLRIRDYGTGLDMDAIETIYSQYGASTKRASNDFNGTLGLGGKSAFAYSSRFTVVSHKDGIRYEVIVTRNEDGTAEMVVMDPTSSIEPTGTCITIAAKRGDTFKDEAAELFQWFPEGSVKVNGKVVKSWRERHRGTSDALEIAPGMFVYDHRAAEGTYGERQDVIVMGNIAYPASLKHSLARRTYQLVVFVPNGSVRFTPSREALAENSITRAKLAEVVATFEKAIIDTVQKHIDAAKSKHEAAAVVANWQNIVPANVVPPQGYEYKGDPIPNSLVIDNTAPFIRHLSTNKSGYHNSHSKQRSMGQAYFGGTLWVEGFTADAVTANHAQKARKYIADKGIQAPNGIALIHAIPPEVKPWLETVVSYEDVKAIKLPRATVSGASGRIPGSYDLFTTEASVLTAYKGAHSGYRSSATCAIKEGVPAETFKHWTAPLFYCEGNRYESENERAALEEVQGTKGYTLVHMRCDRIAKFQRNFPGAIRAKDAIKAGYAEWAQNAGRDALLALSIQQSYDLRNLRNFSEAVIRQIDDPELRHYATLASKDLTQVRAAANMFQRVLSGVDMRVTLTDFSKRYPLMAPSASVKHTIFYINAVYTARQAGQTL